MDKAIEAAARELCPVYDALPKPHARYWYKKAKAAIAAYQAASGEGWQPIETAPKMRKVIVTYVNELGKRRTVMACYYVEHSLEMNDDYEDVGIWVEAIGQSFAPAGWYEEIDHEGDIHALGGDPDYWQPLPKPPAIAAREGVNDGN